MSDARCKDRVFWISSSLIVFVFLSFLTPWDALSRFFLFLIAFPALMSLIYLHVSISFRLDLLVMGSLFFVVTSVTINFILGLDFEDSLQSARWGLTTSVFLVCVYFSAKLWRSNEFKYSSIFFAIVVIVSFSNLAFYFWEGRYPARIEGFGFMDHPIVGPAGLICLWASGVHLLLSSQPVEKRNWFFGLVSLMFLLLIVVLSQSRGPLISILLYLVAVTGAFFLNARLQRGSLLRLGCLVSSVIIVIAVSVSPLIDRMIERGDSYRWDIFSVVISEPPENILLGTGSSADFSESPAGIVLNDRIGVSIEHPHNIILNIYYQSGLPLLIIFVLLIIGLARRVIRNAGSIHSMVSGLSLLGLLLLLNTTDSSRIVAPPSADWMFLWFPFAFLCGYYSEPAAHDDVSRS